MSVGWRAAPCSAAGERGAATVTVLAFVSVLLLLGGALGVVAAMVQAHRTAQAAADLAALAGAGAQARGRDPCATGGAVASANGARLVSCELDGADVRVLVEVSGPRWLGQVSDLAASARAGPG